MSVSHENICRGCWRLASDHMSQADPRPLSEEASEAANKCDVPRELVEAGIGPEGWGDVTTIRRMKAELDEAWEAVPPGHGNRGEDALADVITTAIHYERSARYTSEYLNLDVTALENRLQELYRRRRGTLVQGQQPTSPDEGPIWGWCVGCGKVQVDAAQGQDTCEECHRNR